MDKASTDRNNGTPAGAVAAADTNEPELVALLASLRVEAAPEADFEARFLYDFHERVAREAVCRPARTLLWEHIMQFLVNIGRRRRLAFGATACGAFALCSAYFAWSPAESGVKHAESALTNRFESTLSSLKPGVAKEMTRISVGNRAAATSPATLTPPVLFAEADDSYESSASSRPTRQDSLSLPQSDAVTLPTIAF